MTQIRKNKNSTEGMVSDNVDSNSIVIRCPDELAEMAREFTNGIISFHAADMQDRVIIEKSELNRVKEFISGEVVGQAEGHRHATR